MFQKVAKVNHQGVTNKNVGVNIILREVTKVLVDV